MLCMWKHSNNVQSPSVSHVQLVYRSGHVSHMQHVHQSKHVSHAQRMHESECAARVH